MRLSCLAAIRAGLLIACATLSIAAMCDIATAATFPRRPATSSRAHTGRDSRTARRAATTRGPAQRARCAPAPVSSSGGKDKAAEHAKRIAARRSCLKTVSEPTGSAVDPPQQISQGQTTAQDAAVQGCEDCIEAPGYPQGLAPAASEPPASPEVPSSPEVSGATPFRFFSPSSFWNEPQSANGPLDPSSTALVGEFDSLINSEQQASTGPWINTTSYSVPIYTVPSNQPTVEVMLNSRPAAPSLQAAFSEVPLPPNAQPAPGTDGTLVVWQPSTDKLWEFWRLAHKGDGWQASWGGAMQDVSSSSGAYGPGSWPGAGTYWGASASSLSIVGGLITLEDLQTGTDRPRIGLGHPECAGGDLRLSRRAYRRGG